VKIGCLPLSSLGHAYKVFDHLLKSTTIEDLTCTVDGDEQFYELRNALEKNKILKRLHISVFNLNRTEINDGFCQYVVRLPVLEMFSLSFDTTIDCSRLIRCLTTKSFANPSIKLATSNKSYRDLTVANEFVEIRWID
jgi:hypothetical protein